MDTRLSVVDGILVEVLQAQRGWLIQPRRRSLVFIVLLRGSRYRRLTRVAARNSFTFATCNRIPSLGTLYPR